MRSRSEIAHEANEAMNNLVEGRIVPDLPKLICLLLEVELDIRAMYASGNRPGIETF